MNPPVDPQEVEIAIEAVKGLHSMMDARLLLVTAGILSGVELAQDLEAAAVLLDALNAVAPVETW
jgi:hypothetical protein